MVAFLITPLLIYGQDCELGQKQISGTAELHVNHCSKYVVFAMKKQQEIVF